LGRSIDDCLLIWLRVWRRNIGGWRDFIFARNFGRIGTIAGPYDEKNNIIISARMSTVTTAINRNTFTGQNMRTQAVPMNAQHGMQVQMPSNSKDLDWDGGDVDGKADSESSIFPEGYASDGDLASVFHGHVEGYFWIAKGNSPQEAVSFLWLTPTNLRK
jgi:hypothetical protein